MKTITIFGSSSDSIPQVYKDEAHRLGLLIASEGWHQYNGGGASGVMGAATRGGLYGGGKVHGIIIEVYEHLKAEGLTSCVSVERFHERKQGLIDAGDAIVALPGGVGTLNEIFHVLDDHLADLQRGSKRICPLIILNTNGFYNGMLEWIKARIIKEQFLKEELFQQVIRSVENAEGVLEVIHEYT